jgi:hypothetical protein
MDGIPDKFKLGTGQFNEIKYVFQNDNHKNYKNCICNIVNPVETVTTASKV